MDKTLFVRPQCRSHTVKRLLLAGIAVLVTWDLLDTLAHRLL